MEYEDYVRIYENAVRDGLRDAADMASEPEWNVISVETKRQILNILQNEKNSDEKNQ